MTIDGDHDIGGKVAGFVAPASSSSNSNSSDDVEMIMVTSNDSKRVAETAKKVKSNIDITETNIGLLIDLCHVLEQRKQNKKSPNTDDVNGVFNKCVQHVRRYSDYQELYRKTDLFFDNYIVGLLKLLKESFLTHQWTDALRIVKTIVTENDKIADILWKAGMMSLIMARKPMQLNMYRRHLCQITSPTEVMLDYLLSLLTEGDLNRAEDLLNEVTPMKKTQSTVKILFQAYLGLVDYLNWKTETFQDETVGDSAVDFISSQLSQQTLKVTSKMKADKALSNMACVTGVPGIWDIFIVKMVEMHEFYNDLEAARSVLEDYKTHNPDNLNAHRYLYEFETKHNKKTEEELDSLQNIIRLDPSNPLALKLYKRLVTSDPEAVSILFDYLDFDHCKNDLQAWELLSTNISDTKGRDGANKAVKRCWRLRKAWWPNTRLIQADDDNQQLSMAKNKVRRWLEQKHSLLL